MPCARSSPIKGELRLRAGVNRGRAFVVHLGAPHRRTYTMMGDTTNLAARVMGHASDGTVLATRAVLASARAPFALTPVVPFAVKGKRALVEAELVGEPRAVAARALTDSPLGSREAELAVLREAVAAARAGDGRIVELVGEPGIGKSRLLAEVAGEAVGAGLLKILVEAGAYCTATPYFALRVLLEPADDSEEAVVVSPLTARVREHLPRTEPLLPLLAIAFGLELPATAESARVSAAFSRTQLHLLVDRLLAVLLPRGQTLLLVEDAQWLDEASSDLLRAVLHVGERGWAALVARRPARRASASCSARTRGSSSSRSRPRPRRRSRPRALAVRWRRTSRRRSSSAPTGTRCSCASSSPRRDAGPTSTSCPRPSRH